MNFENIYTSFDRTNIDQFSGTIEQRIYAALRQHFMQAAMNAPGAASRALDIEDPYFEATLGEFFARELHGFNPN